MKYSDYSSDNQITSCTSALIVMMRTMMMLVAVEGLGCSELSSLSGEP